MPISNIQSGQMLPLPRQNTTTGLLPIEERRLRSIDGKGSSGQMLSLTRPNDNTGFLPIKERQFLDIDGKGGDTLEKEKARLREAANDFEAIFIRQLLSSMRSTLSDGGMFGDGTAGEIYSGFMEDAIADKVTERGGLGLSDILYDRMVRFLNPPEDVEAGQAAVFAKGLDEF